MLTFDDVFGSLQQLVHRKRFSGGRRVRQYERIQVIEGLGAREFAKREVALLARCASLSDGTDTPASDASKTRAAKNTIMRLRRTNLLVRYQTVSGRAVIGLWARYRRKSSANGVTETYRSCGFFFSVLAVMVSRSPRSARLAAAAERGRGSVSTMALTSSAGDAGRGTCRMLSRYKNVQQHAEGIDIRCRSHHSTGELFRRGKCPCECSSDVTGEQCRRAGGFVVFDELGDSEIEELHLPIRSDAR